MSSAAVLASAPVNVLSSDPLASDFGKQYGIPLSLLSIKDGVVDTSLLKPPALALIAKPALEALFKSGAIQAASEPRPVPALSLQAQFSGLAGNSITLTFSDIRPNTATPGDTKVNVTVDVKDRRTGLTPASAGAEFGTPTGGTEPSLVKFDAPATELPAATAATKLNAGTPPKLKIARQDGGGDAFTLNGIDNAFFAELTVAIDDVDPVAKTFTMTVALNQKIIDAKLSELPGKLGPLVKVEPAAPVVPPAQGEIRLTGGTSATLAKAAEAVVLSG